MPGNPEEVTKRTKENLYATNEKAVLSEHARTLSNMTQYRVHGYKTPRGGGGQMQDARHPPSITRGDWDILSLS
jgi:hypothetical protein